MIGDAVRDIAHRDDMDVLQFEKSACPPLLHAGIYFKATPVHPAECSRFEDNTMQEIASDPRIQIVVLESLWATPFAGPQATGDGWLVLTGDDPGRMPDTSETAHRLERSLLDTVASLQRAGKRVMIIEDDPSFYVSPVWRFVTSHIALRRQIMRAVDHGHPVDPGTDVLQHQDADREDRSVIESVAQRTGATVYDLRARLCSDLDHCRYRDDSDIYFRDFNHLTEAGARVAMSGFSLKP
jgi:hypothetical protein